MGRSRARTKRRKRRNEEEGEEDRKQMYSVIYRAVWCLHSRVYGMTRTQKNTNVVGSKCSKDMSHHKNIQNIAGVSQCSLRIILQHQSNLNSISIPLPDYQLHAFKKRKHGPSDNYIYIYCFSSSVKYFNVSERPWHVPYLYL